MFNMTWISERQISLIRALLTNTPVAVDEGESLDTDNYGFEEPAVASFNNTEYVLHYNPKTDKFYVVFWKWETDKDAGPISNETVLTDENDASEMSLQDAIMLMVHDALEDKFQNDIMCWENEHSEEDVPF